MMEKVEALTLNIWPHSNTSHIVEWLTRGHGSLVTLVKGAQRPKSIFLGQYDVGYTCELLFHWRTFSDVHIARECTPLNPRPALRQSWRSFAAASYVMSLASAVARHAPPGAELYDLISLTLDALDAASDPLATQSWFLWRFACHTGHRPMLERCAACGAAGTTSLADGLFSPSKGGRVCTPCAGGLADAAPIPSDALETLLQLDNQPAPLLSAEPAEREVFLVIQRILGKLLEYHLDISPGPRLTAVGLMINP